MSNVWQSSNYRLMREIASINKALGEYQQENGQTVLWYEYDAANSSENAVYDEGPSRRWKAPKTVHVLFAMYYESDISPDVTDEGLYELDRLHLTISADQMSKDGVSAPLAPDEHLRDRVIYENDTYEVRKFRLRGRTADSYMVITVDLEHVKPDDTELDTPMGGTTWGAIATFTWATLPITYPTWEALHG